MRLIDRIAQCRLPFIVEHQTTKAQSRLSGAADFATELAACPIRYVLSDDLTRLCTAVAYSRGARALACADLLYIPAERIWVEWCDGPWRAELAHYGFKRPNDLEVHGGRRGAYIRAARSGRRGSLRTFWTVGDSDVHILAGSMEAYFDLDTPEGEEPEPMDGEMRSPMTVSDGEGGDAGVLRRCFRFRYENSWAHYYDHASLTADTRAAVDRHALGTIAIDIPVLLAFFLLLGTRSGLPQRPVTLERLNRARRKVSKPSLLDHIEVFSPLILSHYPSDRADTARVRNGPRLHHVRGHLVRRGSQVFWRVPHLRGSSRSGVIRSRTVTWTFDRGSSVTNAESAHYAQSV